MLRISNFSSAETQIMNLILHYWELIESYSSRLQIVNHADNEWVTN